MTDRKASQRRRNSAGYKHVSGYATEAKADAIQAGLLTADEVDAAITKQGSDLAVKGDK